MRLTHTRVQSCTNGLTISTALSKLNAPFSAAIPVRIYMPLSGFLVLVSNSLVRDGAQQAQSLAANLVIFNLFNFLFNLIVNDLLWLLSICLFWPAKKSQLVLASLQCKWKGPSCTHTYFPLKSLNKFQQFV